MNNPEYVEVKGKKYKINTDYRVALKCNEICLDDDIKNFEKMMAIVYLLYGDEGLNDRNNYAELTDLAFKYLSCGEDIESDGEIDMSFSQDWNLIQASFRSDYGIDLKNEKMHWWDFYAYLNGLTEDCVLNRVRELRTYDTSDIKNIKEKTKIERSKRKFALKKKEPKLTPQQQKGVDEFYKLTGYKKR